MKMIFLFCVAVLIAVSAAICLLSSVPAFSGGNREFVTIVVDPGHGGEDGGAVSTDGVRESDVNLAVSLRFDQLLGLCGIPAVLTRTGDEIAYPESAATIRQRKRADQEYRVALVSGTPKAVLVSVHQNQYSTAIPRGPQVFYGLSSGSEAFGKKLQVILSRMSGTHRQASVISPEIFLLRQVSCPSVLVECGFLSNPEELELLKTDAYQTMLAAALAAGCLTSMQELEQCYAKG